VTLDPNATSDTTITVPQGGASVTFPPGSVSSFEYPPTFTMTNVPGPYENFQVVTGPQTGTGIILQTYDLQMSSFESYNFPAGVTPTVRFQLFLNPWLYDQYLQNALEIATRENGVFVRIPNCNAAAPRINSTADGRCTTARLLINPADGQPYAVEMSAPVTHFTPYYAVSMDNCRVTVGANPKTLNLKANGNYVTVTAKLDASCAYTAQQIDPASLTLRATSPVRSGFINKAPGTSMTIKNSREIEVKFDRQQVQSWFNTNGSITYWLQGDFNVAGRPFFAGQDASVRTTHAPN
jgi:hypothetical protein